MGGLEQCSHCLRTFANIPDVVAPTVAVIAQLCQSGPEDRYGSLPAAAVIVATSEQSTCCHSFQQSAGSTAGSRHSGRFAAAPPTPYRSIRRCRRVPVAGRFALARSPLSSNPMDPGMHSLLTHLYIRPHPYTASTHCICNRACSGIMLDCLACPLGLSTSVSPSTFKGTSHALAVLQRLRATTERRCCEPGLWTSFARHCNCTGPRWSCARTQTSFSSSWANTLRRQRRRTPPAERERTNWYASPVSVHVFC